MKNMNRIKSVFVDTGHTGKWLADQLEKAPVFQNGAPILHNPVWKPFTE